MIDYNYSAFQKYTGCISDENGPMKIAEKFEFTNHLSVPWL
jgi:hypothetical protein